LSDEHRRPDNADVDSVFELVSSLTRENKSLIEGLRQTHIPQHVGMAAAARALGVDLPRVLMAQLQGDLASGTLAKKWEAALARYGEDERSAARVNALAVLLIEQAKATGRYVAVRAEEWAADAFRLEGQATALEEQGQRLVAVHADTSRRRAAVTSSDAVDADHDRQRDEGGGSPPLRSEMPARGGR
jgi:hypothetical protein